jgi:S1-C subfamily serine protease
MTRSLVSAMTLSTNSGTTNKNKSRGRFKKLLFISFGICFGHVAYSLKDQLTDSYFLHKLPSVGHAAAVSKRAQNHLLADMIDVAKKSLVHIEIQDSSRMDYISKKLVTVSSGSGFIVESDGLILTNAHVVQINPNLIGCQSLMVSVKLHDGRTFQGCVEAADPVNDLATVRVSCKNLPPLKLGQ